MLKEWKKWCRLCGKRKDCSIDVNFKLENTETIAVAIMKYFGIMIIEENNYSYKICIICHDTINSIIRFNINAVKVNEMFLELESCSLDQSFDIYSVRKKYGFENEIKDYNQDVVETSSLICKSENKDSEQIFSEPLEKVKTSNDMNHVWLQETKSVAEESDDVSTENEYIAEEILKEKSIKYSKSDKIDMNSNEGYDANSSFSKIDAEKNFECCICDKRFLSARGRTLHLKQIHSVQEAPPSPPYKCETCGRIFQQLRYLKDHSKIHTNEKKYRCTNCEKSYKCKRELRLHMDIHNNTGYICQVCGVKLNTRKILRGHMLVHTDHMKYKCNFCTKEFKRPDAYKNHLILHTGLKPFKCTFCKMTFANGSNCRKHQRISHPGELATAELKGQEKVSKNVPSVISLKKFIAEATANKL